MLELNIRDLRKKALIKFSVKPEGHVFGVHSIVRGDDLKLSELARKANKLILELQTRQEDPKKMTSKELKVITDKIDQIEDERLRVKASVFDDGGDGSLSLALIMELSDEDVKRIVEAVENDQSILPEASEDGNTPS